MFASAADRDVLGRTPSVSDVRAVYTWAKFTDKVRAGEDSWNTNVHSSLLRLALHGGAEHRDQLLDFQSWYARPSFHSSCPFFSLRLNPGSSPDAYALTVFLTT